MLTFKIYLGLIFFSIDYGIHYGYICYGKPEDMFLKFFAYLNCFPPFIYFVLFFMAVL